MLKQPAPTLHKTTHAEITPLFGAAKLVLDETPKAISPFGGLASFISFLGQIGFAREVQQRLPFAEPTSNNAIPLAHSLTAFLMAVVVGAAVILADPIFQGLAIALMAGEIASLLISRMAVPVLYFMAYAPKVTGKNGG